MLWAFVAGVALASPEPVERDEPGGELAAVDEPTPEPVDAPEGQLHIQVASADHAYIQNITCTGEASEDPDLCAELAAAEAEQREEEGEPDFFDEVPSNAVCEEERDYGPGEALITGEWMGEEVDTALNRTDSCEEARWQRLRMITDPMD